MLHSGISQIKTVVFVSVLCLCDKVEHVFKFESAGFSVSVSSFPHFQRTGWSDVDFDWSHKDFRACKQSQILSIKQCTGSNIMVTGPIEHGRMVF